MLMKMYFSLHQMPLKNGTPEIIREVGSIPTKGTINQKLFIMEWMYKYDKVESGSIWIKNNIWYVKLIIIPGTTIQYRFHLN